MSRHSAGLCVRPGCPILTVTGWEAGIHTDSSQELRTQASSRRPHAAADGTTGERTEKKPASRSQVGIPFPSQYLQTVSHYSLCKDQMKRFIPHFSTLINSSACSLFCTVTAVGATTPALMDKFQQRKKDLKTQLFSLRKKSRQNAIRVVCVSLWNLSNVNKS